MAASQYEGAPNKGNEGLSIVDVEPAGLERKRMLLAYPAQFLEIRDNLYYPAHKAIEFYDHYKEDIKLFAEMHFLALRISIAWS